jgi:hypothetical protein
MEAEWRPSSWGCLEAAPRLNGGYTEFCMETEWRLHRGDMVIGCWLSGTLPAVGCRDKGGLGLGMEEPRSSMERELLRPSINIYMLYEHATGLKYVGQTGSHWTRSTARSGGGSWWRTD